MKFRLTEEEQLNLFENVFDVHVPDFISEKKPFIIRSYKDRLLSQYTAAEYVYFLCKGSLRVFDELPNGKDTTVVQVSPGETVGELECLADHKFSSYSVEVDENNSVLMKIGRSDLLQWMSAEHNFCLMMAQNLARKLYRGSKSLIYNISNDSDTLVRNYIISTTDDDISKYGTATINKTRLEIARNCNLCERTVNRSIRKLKEQGLVEIKRGKISLDVSQYKQIRLMY